MSKRLYPAFWWYGGKHYLLPELLKRVPEHRYYLEVFGGAGSLLLHKPSVVVEIYNDVNGELVNLFRVLRDDAKSARLMRLLRFTLYSEREFMDSFQSSDDDVERARRFFVRCAQSFNGAGEAWSFPSAKNPRNRARRFSEMVDRLSFVSERFRNVIVSERDFRAIIPRYDAEGWFMYLDPPYHPDTREAPDVYEYEMSRQDHKELVEVLLSVRHAKVLVSGYDHIDYEPLIDAGWRKDVLSVVKRAGGKPTPAREVLWRNYDLENRETLF